MLLNTQGRVAETTVATLLARLDGTWVTPPLRDGALPRHHPPPPPRRRPPPPRPPLPFRPRPSRRPGSRQHLGFAPGCHV
ncbi:aminotransferase class IV [Pararhodospirillum photometricum]|uniref:aminotransferase class IV n=1 Tax=Pararhodospirillum photometricum TaxID=1084 RepID=UPI0009D924E1